MTLAEYLDAKRERPASFARRAGLKPSTLSLYLSGDRVPRPKFMARIVAATEGQVTANDFHTSTRGEALANDVRQARGAKADCMGGASDETAAVSTPRAGEADDGT